MIDAPDPFDTAALRAAVLDTWSASPTRFREDANAEEDLRLGGYADAWFVELAQNAADAARAAGVPGRMRVELVDGELRVANTGAPLDAAGVAALASLRASAKRDSPDSVGRFGVGFAAVLALSDAPRVVSTGGGVAFSAAGTAAAVAALPGPAAELARRDGQLPVLRLVWPAGPDERPPPGFDTEVRLPLRAGVDGADLLAQVRAAAPDLLLALPDLEEINEARARKSSPGRRFPRTSLVAIGERRWLLARRAGRLGDADAAALAVEQRGRRDWAVCWALPLAADGSPDPLDTDLLHAPTAAAERLSLPARLIATLPLEPDRRRLRPGPVTDRVLDEAAAAYVELVRAVDPGHRLGLVPVPGFPRSEPDAQLRELLLAALRTAEWLPGVSGGEVVAGRAEWLDLGWGESDRLPALLAETGAFPGLLAPTRAGAALAELGVHRLTADEMVARLLGAGCPPSWWRAVYAELEPAAETVPGLLDALRALPVPLADGRTAAGPATVLLPPDPPADAIARIGALGLPGLHLAHPDAVHPLLARLGAGQADAPRLLDHPALLDAVERSVDDADAGLDVEPLARAVLELVAEPGGATTRPALAALALPDADGRPARADELMLPDAALAPLLAPDAPLGVLDAGWAVRHPRAGFVAIGLVDGFGVLVDEEPVAPDHDLDDEDRWWEGLDSPPRRLAAVRDLDLVDDGAWPAALRLLAAEPATRSAVLEQPSYTAWWLARHARIGGRRPGSWRLPSATGLAALYDPAPIDPAPIDPAPIDPAPIDPAPIDPAPIDDAFLAAAGVRTDLAVADTHDARDLLERLADPGRHPRPDLVAAAHAALADAVVARRVDPADLDPPERVRAIDGTVVDVDVAMVIDAPWLAAVLPPGELVAGGRPDALADLLDLPLASDVVVAEVRSTGQAVRWGDLPEVVRACSTLAVPVPDGDLLVHDELRLAVTRPTPAEHSVPAWLDASGRWHASDPLRALLGLLAAGEAPRSTTC